MAAPTGQQSLDLGVAGNSTAKPRKRKNERKVEAKTPPASRKQASPKRSAENKSPLSKYIFPYNGGGQSIVLVKDKWGEKLGLTKATANMEGGLTDSGRANHESRGVRHGKTLVIFPDKPIQKNGKWILPNEFQLQVPSDANYNDVVNFLNPHSGEIWAFKWGKTTSFYYKQSVGGGAAAK